MMSVFKRFQEYLDVFRCILDLVLAADCMVSAAESNGDRLASKSWTQLDSEIRILDVLIFLHIRIWNIISLFVPKLNWGSFGDHLCSAIAPTEPQLSLQKSKELSP